jgi:quercetin dioxygenase-like cupin family protein
MSHAKQTLTRNTALYPEPVNPEITLGDEEVSDVTLHPGMHKTHSIDIICLLQGEASLILESGETRLRPGNVVIQRGTNHAWNAHGGPALFLAVLIDRDLRHH